MTQQQKDFLIELGKTDIETRKAFPELFRLETGKWYEGEDGALMFFLGEYDEDGDPLGYVFLKSGIWCEKNNSGWRREWHEASPETVKAALIAEAKKRYKVGDVVADLSVTDCAKGDRVVNGDFDVDNAGVWFYNEKRYYVRVFHDGEWATVITPTPSIEDDIKALREKHPDYCLTIIVEKK